MASGRLGRVARSVVADVTPLRVSPAYRRLWLGLGVSNIGQQMTAVAVALPGLRDHPVLASSSGWSAASRWSRWWSSGCTAARSPTSSTAALLMLWTAVGLALLSAVLLAQALLGTASRCGCSTW